jgi:hypothetical protein
LTGIAAGGWTDNGTIIYPTVTSDNVGIGTTAGTDKLTVRSAASGFNAATFYQTGVGNVIQATQADANDMVVQWNRSAGTTANWQWYIPSSSTDLRMYNSGYRVTFQAGGNVGIGSTVPGGLLDVAGTALLRGAAGQTGLAVSSGGNVGVGTSAPSAKFELMGAGTTSSTKSFNVRASDGTSRVTILDNGNVGIGSSAPTQVLDVIGTVKATAFIGDGSGLTNLPGGSSGWSASGTNVYTTTSSNNVGIGTSVPRQKLEVIGTTTVSGNVGIGTSSPDYTLEVNGNIKGREYMFLDNGGNSGAYKIGESVSVNGYGSGNLSDYIFNLLNGKNES